MANSVKVNFPNLPKGDPIVLDGIGTIPNGATTKVDDFQVQTWEAFNGSNWPEDGVLVLPAPAPERNPNDEPTGSELEAAIIARQEARSPEEAKAEELAAVAAALRGNVTPDPLIVDGKVIRGTATEKADPVVAASTTPEPTPIDSKGK